MTLQTRISEKGQVVVPKATRDRLGWQPGTDLDVIETGDGIMLRRRAMPNTLTVDAAVARLRSLYRHEGAPVPLEQLNWSAAVDDADL
ncbi:MULTISPECIES: AbrB/MazE/SpoVT family DNA-binding domain-containing protein [unclassified Sphingomonas]|uniref:AbrB/MazE/SpoVT family DNA-binding domain-containing protein n=1 Tax=unclassified Sphingomonas TaxID=196159 RepID=UPI001F587400|nr:MULTISPECIES: AbrB/MazE/SpoVT family DNA-binding domain-containing protein [unclassified Sphingomonas]